MANHLIVKEHIVFVSIIALFGKLSLKLPLVNVVSGQNVTTTTSTTPMRASDFVVVPIQQHLGDNKNDIFAPSYPYRGDVSRHF